MKNIDTGLMAHYEQTVTTVAQFIKIVREDGATFGFTSTNIVVTVAGLEYEPGWTPTAIASSEALSVDNFEMVLLPDLDGGNVTAIDLQTGKWDNAFFEIFEADYLTPNSGQNILKRGWTGNVTIRNGQFVIEFRSLSQRLQPQQGILLSKTCRAQLGDSKCRVNLMYFTVTGTLTAVASNQVFTDSSRTEVDDWFGEGIIEFTSGANAGYRRKVKSYTDAGVFTVFEAFPFDVEVGDTYEAIAGCRKRHDRQTSNPTGVSDCVDKFDNILNFQGEPHGQGSDKLTANPS